MFPKRFSGVLADPVWVRVLSFSVVLFFIFLGDAILSFWVPNLLQDALGSPEKMGLIISFSSLIGLLVDLSFPQAITSITVKRLVTWGAMTGMLFSVLLLSSLKFPVVLIFLAAMAVWGIYYNFLNYSSQQFIADMVPLKDRSGGWAIFGAFKNIAYFIGPLLAAWLLLKGEWIPATVDIFLLTLGLSLIFLIKKVHDRPLSIEISSVNILAEMEHWGALIRVVWPIVALSLCLGIIDATFWTTGTVLTESLTRQNFWGSFFLPLYQLPSLFIGLIFVRLKIFEGKKKLAMQLLICASIFLILLGFVTSIPLILLTVLGASLLLAAVYPLVEGVYTDIVTRMGRERKHMLGLSDSTSNLGYIIGPVVAGFITSWVGNEKTFSVLGIFVLIVGVTLLIFTPRKLRLPQEEIKSWE